MQRDTYTKEEFWAELEALGEESVRVAHKAEQRWGKSPYPKAELVELWLRSKEEARALDAANRRDAREDRTLAIAEEALSIAREANRIASEDLAAARSSARWAMYAAIIATVAAAIAAKDQILELMFGS